MNTSFLKILGNNCNFLINKNEITSSIFLTNSLKLNTNLKYLDSIIKYQDLAIFLFDLNSYLNTFFKDSINTKSSIILIYNLNSGNENLKNFLKNIISNNKLDRISSDYIGLKISSNIEITQLDIENLRFIPYTLRKKAFDNGILGVNFYNISNLYKIEFWISIENIIMNKLFKTIVIRSDNNENLNS